MVTALTGGMCPSDKNINKLRENAAADKAVAQFKARAKLG
jgi:hypothetical protein